MRTYVSKCICMCICVYVYMCICVYVYMCICVYVCELCCFVMRVYLRIRVVCVVVCMYGVLVV